MKTGLGIQPVRAYDESEGNPDLISVDVPYSIKGYSWVAWWKDEALNEKNEVCQYGNYVYHHDIRPTSRFEIPQADKDHLLKIVNDAWWEWATVNEMRLVRKDKNGKHTIVQFTKLSKKPLVG